MTGAGTTGVPRVPADLGGRPGPDREPGVAGGPVRGWCRRLSYVGLWSPGRLHPAALPVLGTLGTLLGPRHPNGHPGHVETRRTRQALRPTVRARPTAIVRTRPTAAVRTGLVTAVVLAVAACTGPSHQVGSTEPPTVSPSAATPDATLPPDALAGVVVEIRQSRSDWAARVVQLRVVNGTKAEVTIAAAELTAPTVEGTAVWAAIAPRRVPEGRHRDLSVPLGPATCPLPDTDGAVPRVTLVVVDAHGRTATTDIVPTDPQGHLTRIHGEDCAAAALDAAADVRLDRLTVEDRDGTLVGVLDLTVVPRTGGPPVGIGRIDGTVLLAPVGGAAWSPPELAAVAGPTTVGLELVPARCDPHAVAEDKRGTFLGLHATVGGVAQPVVYLDSGDDLRGDLHDYLARACGRA